jgi:hypothetical protein
MFEQVATSEIVRAVTAVGERPTGYTTRTSREKLQSESVDNAYPRHGWFIQTDRLLFDEQVQ